MKKNILFFLFFNLNLFLNLSCNTTEPNNSNNDKDTTSHNFAFQTWSFGEHSSSILYDVAIINENDIWAVGEIYTADSYTYDSLGNWIDPYNSIHWDGNHWELVRIYYNYNGSNIWSPIRTILAFGSNDIWFGAGINWDGTDFITKPMNINFPYQINKMWGTSSNDFYAIGNSGSIAHYQNGSWTKINSNTDLDFYDIWGEYNSASHTSEIIAIAAKQFVSYDKKIIKINGSNVQTLASDSIPHSIHGVWFKSYNEYFICGSGLYSKNNIYLNNKWKWVHPELTNYYLYAIRGKDLNDIFVCGAFGELLHFNGASWKSYINNTWLDNGAFNGISFYKNLVVSVGYNGSRAILTTGKRE